MRTFYYLVGVAVDDDGTILGANVETDTALGDPGEPVYVDELSEWRAVGDAEGDFDRETLMAINAALLARFGERRV